MSYMKEFDDNLLLLLAQNSKNDGMQRYIKSILHERYMSSRNVSELYKKMKRNESVRNDIIWSSIANIIGSGSYLVLSDDLDEMLKSMPMEYLAIISTSNIDEVLRTKARELCYKKQEEYEKEIGIYDRGHELKYGLRLLK